MVIMIIIMMILLLLLLIIMMLLLLLLLLIIVLLIIVIIPTILHLTNAHFDGLAHSKRAGAHVTLHAKLKKRRQHIITSNPIMYA